MNEIKQYGTFNENSSQRRIVFDKNGLCPTLQAAMGIGGGNTPMIIKKVDNLKTENIIVTERNGTERNGTERNGTERNGDI